MENVFMIKMPFKTKHFKINQKVWAQYLTGMNAVRVAGRFRGRGRYVSAWVNYEPPTKKALVFRKIKVSKEFMIRHDLFSWEDGYCDGIYDN